MPYRLEKFTDITNPIYQQVLDYYEHCEFQRNMTPATMEGKTVAINNFVKESGLRDLGDITNSHIDDWVTRMRRRGNQASTINMRLKHLIPMLKWQRDDNLHMDNLSISRICMLNTVAKRKRFFRSETVVEALAYANRMEWLLIKIMFDCGLRLNELRNLRLKDVDGDTIYYMAKGRKQRQGVLSQEVQVRLDDWIKSRRIIDYLWPSKRDPHKPMTEGAFRKAIKRPFALAGITMVPHDLRRSFANDFLELGVSKREIQHMMGHSSIRTTEMYLAEMDDSEARRLYHLKYSREITNLR